MEKGVDVGAAKAEEISLLKAQKTLLPGVDSWRNAMTRLWFDLPVTLDSYLSAATICWTDDIFNICLQFVHFAYSLWYLLVLSSHSILSVFVIIFFKEVVRIYLVWLSTFNISIWLICIVVKLMIGIIAYTIYCDYCMILVIFEFLLIFSRVFMQ